MRIPLLGNMWEKIHKGHRNSEPKPPSETVEPKILLTAADIIDQNGLARLDLVNANGEYCVYGAMAIARGYTVTRTTTVMDFYEQLEKDATFIFLAELLDERRGWKNSSVFSSIYRWSDSNDKETVVKGLREAASIAQFKISNQ